MKVLPKEFIGVTVSKGTLRVENLILNTIEFLENLDDDVYRETVNIDAKRTIEEGKMVTRLMELADQDERIEEYNGWKEKAEYIFYDLDDIMASIAPEDSYYGALPGNSSLFGFWKYEEEE